MSSLHLKMAVLACFMIAIIGTGPLYLSSGSRPFTTPTRGDDFQMDMNVSDAALASFKGEAVNDKAGLSVAVAGDVNGDGLDDIIIGAQGNGEGGSGAGKSYLIFGKASGWSMDVDLGTVDASFIGEDADDASGKEVSAAGDVNGDGYDDFLIGAPNDDEGAGGGQTYLILGKQTGWAMDTDLSNADASFLGENSGDVAGYWASAAGDVNSDGFDDFLISAYQYSGSTGQTYLILGKQTGWAMDTSLGNVNASFIGEGSGTWSGTSVAGAGDLNGDGYDDILVGSSDIDGGKGQTYVIFGKRTGWAMDTNLADSDASFGGEGNGEYSGIFVAGPGDVNGDGYDDIIIDASNNGEAGGSFGQVYLVFGKETGWEMDRPLSTYADASFLGEHSGSWRGREIWGAGDVNGDGLNDLLIGDQYSDESYENAGQVYLIFGKESGWARDVRLNESDISFIGDTSGSQLGFSVSGGGDINGDGNDDILLGAPQDGVGPGRAYLVSIEGFSEPLEVYDVIVRNTGGAEINKADIGETVVILMTGLDRNVSHMDKARVNISFITGKPLRATVSLLETGLSTGTYRGVYKVDPRADYFQRMLFSAYTDQTKSFHVTVDYPYRPAAIVSLGVYPDLTATTTFDKLDLDQIGYIKCSGLDSNKLTVDKAFVNLTSDRNATFRPMLVMTETGTSTGVYTVTFTVLRSMVYFENITLTSSESPSVTARFMVHTPVQVRTAGKYLTANEDMEYRARFYNFGYNPVVWTVTTDAYWLLWNDSLQELHGTPRNNDVGKDLWNVIVKAEDPYGNTHDIEFTLDVNNAPPIILTDPILECTENEEYFVDLESDDDGLGDINWYLNTNAPFLTIQKGTGSLSGTPIEGDEGVYKVNVQVQDGNGGSDNIMYDLTVQGKNDRPRITTSDIKQVEQDAPYRRDYDVFDPDEGDTHFWALRTDAEWLDLENGTGVLYGTPSGLDIGDWLVNITVTDQGGLSDGREFVLKVLDVKDRPKFDSIPGNTEVLHGTRYYFDVNATDTDEGSILIYSIFTEPDSDMVIDQRTGEMFWKASYRSMPPTGVGMIVSIKVSDGELFTVHEFNIKVTPTSSPWAELASPMKGARTLSGNTYLDWNGTDMENEPLSYTLYLADSMSYVSAKREDDIIARGITETNFNVTGLVQGKTYYWTVIPDDGCTSGTCSNGIYSFRVNSRPVLLAIEDQAAEVGSGFRLKISASDGDQDDTVSYSLYDGPSGMDVKVGTGMLEWTPGSNHAGTHTVIVRATDGYETSELTFDIEVSESSGSNIGIILGAVVVVLLVVIIALVLYLIVFRKRPSEEEVVVEEEDEESKRIREELEQLRNEKDWEAAHSKPSDQVVASVPSSVAEAHAQDRTSKKKGYEDLYGQPAPDKTEELTTVELKGELEKLTEELKDSMEQT